MQISAYLLLELMSNTLCLLTIMPQYVCCEKCCEKKTYNPVHGLSLVLSLAMMFRSSDLYEVKFITTNYTGTKTMPPA